MNHTMIPSIAAGAAAAAAAVSTGDPDLQAPPSSFAVAAHDFAYAQPADPPAPPAAKKAAKKAARKAAARAPQAIDPHLDLAADDPEPPQCPLLGQKDPRWRAWRDRNPLS